VRSWHGTTLIPLELPWRSTTALKLNVFWPQNYTTSGGDGSVWYDDMVVAKDPRRLHPISFQHRSRIRKVRRMVRFSVAFAVTLALPLAACSGSNGAGAGTDTSSSGSGGSAGTVINAGGSLSSGGTGTAGSNAGGSAIGAGGSAIGAGGSAIGAGGSAISAGGSAVGFGGSTANGNGGALVNTGGSTSTNGSPRLFYLDVLGGRVLSADPSGANVSVLVTGATGTPDGVAVDVTGGHLFWTNMGAPSVNDGFVDRTNLDGTALSAIVPPGGTFTPKQLKLDAQNQKLYWSDREGMRVMRANLDGSNVETLVETAQGDTARQDASNWCVGIAVDVPGKAIYWTQKGGDNANVGSIRRAGIEIPAGEDAAHRTDVRVLFTGLPEPIDIDLDLTSRTMYWTDRGNPPKGNTVSRAPMDPPPSFDPAARADQQILVSNLHEGIGITLDLANAKMYFTDLGGTVYASNLDGTDERSILTGQGILTGITYAILPK